MNIFKHSVPFHDFSGFHITTGNVDHTEAHYIKDQLIFRNFNHIILESIDIDEDGYNFYFMYDEAHLDYQEIKQLYLIHREEFKEMKNEIID